MLMEYFRFDKKKSLKIPKGAIRIRISKKSRQHIGQRKSTKGQITINKTHM